MLRYLTMDRASDGVSETPFTTLICFNALCQLSGVARAQEMRFIFPRSSRAWQLPHLAITTGSVTGIPSSRSIPVTGGIRVVWPETTAVNKAQQLARHRNEPTLRVDRSARFGTVNVIACPFTAA